MKKIILSRTDSIGDVILTLPLAGVLKNHFPGCHIIFIGKAYTQPVIEACSHVDQFVDWDKVSGLTSPASKKEALQAFGADVIIHVFPVKDICLLAKEAGIPIRISTSHRWYSWLYCNKRVHFSRKKSDLHEAQLNLTLLEPLGIREIIATDAIPQFYGLNKLTPKLPDSLLSSLSKNHFNLILHPKSKGSAREWGLENYSRLISLLPKDRFRIFITGTKEEGGRMKEFLASHSNDCSDLTGKLSLPELLSLITLCDGLVAASTGPLHIAAALGKRAIGLYAPMRPIFPKRWAPLGKNADYLVLGKSCDKCSHSEDCQCIRDIRPEAVAEKLLNIS